MKHDKGILAWCIFSTVFWFLKHQIEQIYSIQYLPNTLAKPCLVFSYSI